MREMWAKTACVLLALVFALVLVQARALEPETQSLTPHSDSDVSPSFLELSSSHGWVNGVRHRRRFRSIRAERERAAQKEREEAVYAENLRRLAMRTQKFRAPAAAAMPQILAETQSTLRAQRNGMSPEMAAVESLLQVSAKPTLELQHVNDVRERLTPELLHGRGLHNAANRRATAAGLAASPRNRPAAPAFVQLPPLLAGAAPAQQQPLAQAQPVGVSLLATQEQARPHFMGPPTASLPSQSASAPTVLQSTPAPGSALAAKPAPASNPAPEHAFVAGLPPAFMELDSATQLQILQLVDAGVDVEAQAHADAAQEAKAKAETKAPEQPKVEAHSQPKAEAAKPAPAASAAAASDAVGEDELASAATALNTLALLQKESHGMPMNKLIRLLAAKGKQA